MLSLHCNISSDFGEFLYTIFKLFFKSSAYSSITVHIFDMSLNKYGCPIVNMSHTAIMLNGHKDATFLHTCNKNNQVQYLLHMLLPCCARN